MVRSLSAAAASAGRRAFGAGCASAHRTSDAGLAQDRALGRRTDMRSPGTAGARSGRERAGRRLWTAPFIKDAPEPPSSTSASSPCRCFCSVGTRQTSAFPSHCRDRLNKRRHAGANQCTRPLSPAAVPFLNQNHSLRWYRRRFCGHSSKTGHDWPTLQQMRPARSARARAAAAPSARSPDLAGVAVRAWARGARGMPAAGAEPIPLGVICEAGPIRQTGRDVQRGLRRL